VVGHITPESYEGGLIGMVEDDDPIEIDAVNKTITLKLPAEVISKRKSIWKRPALKARKGILYKYAQQVRTAAEGCVTDE